MNEKRFFSKLLLITLLLIFPLYQSHAVSFNFSIGAASIGYDDLHEGDSTANFELARYVLNTEGEMKVPLGTRLLQFSTAFQYQGPTLFNSSTQEIGFWNYNTRLIIKIPSKPFNLDVIAEYGQDTSEPSGTTFGYGTFRGVRYLVSLSAFVPKYKFMIDLIYPVQNYSDEIVHYQGIIKYFFTLVEGKGSDDVGIGTFAKIGFDYRKVTDTTTEAYTIFRRVRTITFNIGAYF